MPPGGRGLLYCVAVRNSPRKPLGFAGVNISTPDTKILEMSKYSVEIRNPQNQDDDYDAIQDRFNLSLHWDEPVYKPQQKPCGNKRDQDSGKWHFVFLQSFLVSVHI